MVVVLASIGKFWNMGDNLAYGRSVAQRPMHGRAGGECGRGVPLPHGGSGVLAPKFFFNFRCSYVHF